MFVVSPTDQWLREAFAGSTKAVRISSPFVGTYLRDRILELHDSIEVTLLTRTLIADFASHASDFDAVCSIAERTGGVLSLDSLHAKVYVVDEKRALVTSANATYSGMYRNAECGIEISKRKPVMDLLTLFGDAFGRRHLVQSWSLGDLQSLREPINVLTRSAKRLNTTSSSIEELQRFEIDSAGFEELVESFSGWLRLTLTGIAKLNGHAFVLSELYKSCEQLALKQFPSNRYPRQKIRQQLQRLRDLGIVHFLGKGRYELLALRKR